MNWLLVREGDWSQKALVGIIGEGCFRRWGGFERQWSDHQNEIFCLASSTDEVGAGEKVSRDWGELGFIQGEDVNFKLGDGSRQ